MLNKKGYLVMNSIMNLANAAALSITGALMNHALDASVLIMILISFCCAWIVTVVIPVQKLGGAFAALFHLEPRTTKAGLVSNLVVTLIYVLVINFVMTAINVGFVMPVLFIAYLSTLPALYVVSYVVSTLVTPLALKAAMKADGASR